MLSNSPNPMLKYLTKNDKKSEMFHSSGYAEAQSGENFGTDSGETFQVRRSIDEQRKFVKKYNNSRIVNEVYAFDKVKKFIPRTNYRGEDGAGANGGARTGDVKAGGAGNFVGRNAKGGFGASGVSGESGIARNSMASRGASGSSRSGASRSMAGGSRGGASSGHIMANSAARQRKRG